MLIFVPNCFTKSTKIRKPTVIVNTNPMFEKMLVLSHERSQVPLGEEVRYNESALISRIVGEIRQIIRDLVCKPVEGVQALSYV